MVWSSLLLALRAIRRNLLRSFLTVLGIVIGVGAVITMVTLGNGATRRVADQIGSLGSNLIIVRPGQQLGPMRDGSAAPRFKEADAEAIQAQIDGLKGVAPVATRASTVVYGANNWATSITGSTAAYFEVANWRLAGGRVFTDGEQRAGEAVCVIGETIRKQLFGRESPLGSPLRVGNFSCEVIGMLASKGQSAMGSDQDDITVIPLRALQRRLTGTLDVNSLMVSARDGASIDGVMTDLRLLLRERRKLAENADDNFSILDTRQIAETMTNTTKVMTGLLGAVAAVSLLVGGIGIMNIMLVSVTERTREIGIRLAIGALEREVLLQFLVEAVALSSLGGLIGIALAALASIGLAQAMQVPYLFDPRINLVSFAFSAAIGVIFGYFPARRAARLDPIEALRHE
ncbi:MAG TPA: ABC transporter permease [Candidatus Competibacter sp.]|nr:multidrug ABC transporter substrate-binding protein [Candidatus Competibacteraceae bacterium]HUM93095.1 ABC transporter permease [Candidatus Competibacter sp.]